MLINFIFIYANTPIKQKPKLEEDPPTPAYYPTEKRIATEHWVDKGQAYTESNGISSQNISEQSEYDSDNLHADCSSKGSPDGESKLTESLLKQKFIDGCHGYHCDFRQPNFDLFLDDKTTTDEDSEREPIARKRDYSLPNLEELTEQIKDLSLRSAPVDYDLEIDDLTHELFRKAMCSKY